MIPGKSCQHWLSTETPGRTQVDTWCTVDTVAAAFENCSTLRGRMRCDSQEERDPCPWSRPSAWHPFYAQHTTSAGGCELGSARLPAGFPNNSAAPPAGPERTPA